MMSQSISSYPLLQCIVSAAEFAGGELTFYPNYAELIAADAHRQTTSPLALAYDDIRHFRVVRTEHLLRISVPRVMVLRWADDNGFDSQLDDHSDADEDYGDDAQRTKPPACPGADGNEDCHARQPPRTAATEALCTILCQLGRAEFAHFLDTVAPTVAATRRRRSASRISVTDPLRLRCHIADPAVSATAHRAPTEQDETSQPHEHTIRSDAHKQGAEPIMVQPMQVHNHATAHEQTQQDKAKAQDRSTSHEESTRCNEIAIPTDTVNETHTVEHATPVSRHSAAVAGEREDSVESLPAVWRTSAVKMAPPSRHAPHDIYTDAESDTASAMHSSDERVVNEQTSVSRVVVDSNSDSPTTSERVCAQLDHITESIVAVDGGAPLPRSRLPPRAQTQDVTTTRTRASTKDARAAVAVPVRAGRKRARPAQVTHEAHNHPSPHDGTLGESTTPTPTPKRPPRTPLHTSHVTPAPSSDVTRTRNKPGRRAGVRTSTSLPKETPYSAFTASLLGDLCTLLPARRRPRGRGGPRSLFTPAPPCLTATMQRMAAAVSSATQSRTGVTPTALSTEARVQSVTDVCTRCEHSRALADEEHDGAAAEMHSSSVCGGAAHVQPHALTDPADEEAAVVVTSEDVCDNTHAEENMHCLASHEKTVVAPHVRNTTPVKATTSDAVLTSESVVRAGDMLHTNTKAAGMARADSVTRERVCALVAPSLCSAAVHRDYPFPLLMTHENEEEEAAAHASTSITAAAETRRAVSSSFSSSCMTVVSPPRTREEPERVEEAEAVCRAGARRVRVRASSAMTPRLPDSSLDDESKRRLMRQLNVFAHSLAVLKESHEELRSTLLRMMDNSEVQ